MSNIRIRRLFFNNRRWMIEGELKSNKTRLVQAWIEIHQEELMVNWELATNGQEIFKIDPLK
jgi:hypothetical protein